MRSRNLVSIRILKELGIATAIDYITRFGFDARALPHDLTLALGTMEVTPLDVAAGYAVFANGGYRVQPYFIDRIEDAAGQVVWRAAPKRVCPQCEPAAAPGVPGEPAAQAVQTADATHGEPPPLPPAAVAPRVISAAERLRDGRHDGGRDQARHRAARAVAQPKRHRRQDRHDERSQGHLVQWLHPQPRRHRVGGLRPGAPPR